jgi:hypothetical protein
MKTKTLLIAAVLFFALSVSAFAQSAFTVSQETLDKVACCGLAEPTGAIAFTAVADTPPSVTGTITLTYNLPIANTGSGLTGVQVTAVDEAGAMLATQPSWTVTNENASGVATSHGVIVIAVPAGYVYPNTINVFNVRVNVSGSCDTAIGAVEALASSTGNRLTIGETDAISLVKAVAQPLKTPVVSIAPNPPLMTTVDIDAGDGTVTGTATIKIDENFITAFGTTGTFPDIYRSQQTLIRLKVSPIPTGVAITFPGAAGIFGTANSAGTFSGADVTLGASTLPQVVYYVMTAGSNPALTDALTFSPTVSVVTSTFPLAPSSITISAAMAPITSLNYAQHFPEFIEGCETDAVPFVTIEGVKNTILMIPYASMQVGYDTGVAIANTTMDPGTVNMGNFQQAIRQTGGFTMYFYPADGSSVDPYVSTDHPDEHGLDENGKLQAGMTFVAMLSEVLPEDVTSFSGYVFIVTDFTNGHGEYFISNFDNFTHGSLMLVVNDLDRAISGAGRTQEQGLNQ